MENGTNEQCHPPKVGLVEIGQALSIFFTRNIARVKFPNTSPKENSVATAVSFYKVICNWKHMLVFCKNLSTARSEVNLQTFFCNKNSW